MNEADQTFRVDAVLPDSIVMTYIHASVEANIVIQKKEHSLVVPRNAIVADDSVIVHSISGNKTVLVQTGIITLDEVEIISGIDDKAEVVIPKTK